MDLPGVRFYVESKKRISVNPFSLLSSGFQQSPVPHELQGVPLTAHKMDEHCFPHLFDKYTDNLLPEKVNGFAYSRNIFRNEQFAPIKEMCGQYNQFPTTSISKLVGGFVGSKSQVGSANREACQIWDVIFRQLAKTACHSTDVQKHAHQCYNFGKTLSQNIFDTFCEEGKSAFDDIASYFISRNCSILKDPEMPESRSKSKFNSKHIPVQLPSLKEEKALARSTESGPHPLVRDDSFFSSVKAESNSEPSLSSTNPKQSYAEVAKSLVTCKPKGQNITQPFCRTAVNNKSPSKYAKKISGNGERKEPSHNQKSVDKYNWRERTEPMDYNQQRSSQSTRPSQNHQYKNSNAIHPMFKRQEHGMGTRGLERDRFEHVWNHSRPKSSHADTFDKRCNRKAKCSPGYKGEASPTDRKLKHAYKGSELRIPESREESTNCDMDKENLCNSYSKFGKTCRNWRCKHNRMSYSDTCDIKKDVVPTANNISHTMPTNVIESSMTDSGRGTTSNTVTESSGSDSCSPGIKISACSQDNSPSEDIIGSPSLVRELSSSVDSNSVISLVSVSCYSNMSDTSGLRKRYSSECSIDSEDSFVVMFESDCTVEAPNGECDARIVFQCTSLDSDASDSWSECDSSDDDSNDGSDDQSDAHDEVDFCYFSPSLSVPGQNCQYVDNLFPPVSSRLGDINAKWEKEYSTFPCSEKTSEKVRFAGKGSLVTLHPMVKWDYAYRAARCGPWEEMARDRARFQARIDRTEPILAPVLAPEHRRKVQLERMDDAAIT